MDLSKSYGRIRGGDLSWSHPHLLVPDGDVLHLNSVAEDARLPGTRIGRRWFLLDSGVLS
jgi:hypothetical protein